MLQREHSAILSTIIKPSFVIKIFVLSIFKLRLKTGLTVQEVFHVYLNKFENAVSQLFLVIFGNN